MSGKGGSNTCWLCYVHLVLEHFPEHLVSNQLTVLGGTRVNVCVCACACAGSPNHSPSVMRRSTSSSGQGHAISPSPSPSTGMLRNSLATRKVRAHLCVCCSGQPVCS